jgi:hypothetical protein
VLAFDLGRIQQRGVNLLSLADEHLHLETGVSPGEMPGLCSRSGRSGCLGSG